MARNLRRIGLGILAILLLGGVYAGVQRKGLQARYSGYKLRTATTDEARLTAACQLIEAGDDGTPYLVEAFRGDDAERCNAVSLALRDYLKDLQPTDPRFAALCRPHLGGFAEYSEVGQESTLGLVPDFLRSPDPDAIPRCREIVRAALKHRTAEVRIRAIPLAMRAELDQKADIAPSLQAPEAEVRRAAMLAVGPASSGAPVIGDEELFAWLNDADSQVQMLCEAALSTRGLEPEQIGAARKLTNPDAAERLKLLIDLRWNRDAIRDPGPWLERLSRDADPAVRAGAARVAYECKLAFAGWLDRLAKDDPDGTVRQIVQFHRSRAAELKQVGYGGE